MIRFIRGLGTMGAAMARKIERWAFERASRVVMNSESAVTLYRDAYEDIAGGAL